MFSNEESRGLLLRVLTWQEESILIPKKEWLQKGYVCPIRIISDTKIISKPQNQHTFSGNWTAYGSSVSKQAGVASNLTYFHFTQYWVYTFSSTISLVYYVLLHFLEFQHCSSVSLTSSWITFQEGVQSRQYLLLSNKYLNRQHRLEFLGFNFNTYTVSCVPCVWMKT